MFPLGTVLFPHGVLPLHVFEPRYRTMTERCLADDATFGVVLIERGSEVGGHDERFGVGTAARILQAGRLDDGRYVLMTVGEHRVRVERWLPDDPYPRAEVEALADAPAGPDAANRRDTVGRILRQALALKAELGEPAAAATVELDADPAVAAYQAAALAPLGALDRQRLLEQEGPDQRLALLASDLAEEVAVLAHRASWD